MSKPRYDVGETVLCGLARCKVVRAEYFNNRWQYDLLSLTNTTKQSRLFCLVQEQYIKQFREEDAQQTNLVAGVTL